MMFCCFLAVELKWYSGLFILFVPLKMWALPLFKEAGIKVLSHHVCGSAANAECNTVLYIHVPKSLKEAMVLDQGKNLGIAVLTAVAFTI